LAGIAATARSLGDAKMKDLNAFDDYRVTHPLLGAGDAYNGAFLVPYPRTGVTLKVIVSDGDGWDHVSVSLDNRCPNWLEMDFIKRLFFQPQETAMQLHVPETDHISFHPNCLHLWRPQYGAIPRPPNELVGGV
jgi:hypothetical protein